MEERKRRQGEKIQQNPIDRIKSSIHINTAVHTHIIISIFLKISTNYPKPKYMKPKSQ